MKIFNEVVHKILKRNKSVRNEHPNLKIKVLVVRKIDGPSLVKSQLKLRYSFSFCVSPRKKINLREQ